MIDIQQGGQLHPAPPVFPNVANHDIMHRQPDTYALHVHASTNTVLAHSYIDVEYNTFARSILMTVEKRKFWLKSLKNCQNLPNDLKYWKKI